MSENIGYHTRSVNNDEKVIGGSFGGRIDQETVERLTRFFTVTVMPSGTPVFVDDRGRRVRLYLTVDPSKTEKGKAALAAWRKEKIAEKEAAEKLAEAQNEHLAHLLSRLSYEEAVRRLS
jgi:hypothetical protein